MDGENKMEQYFFTVSTLTPKVFFFYSFRYYALLVTPEKTVPWHEYNYRPIITSFHHTWSL